MSLEVDEEDVVSEGSFGWAAFDARQVDAGTGELPQDLVQATGAVPLQGEGDARAIATGRRLVFGHHQYEPSDVLVLALERRGEHDETVPRRRLPRTDSRGA